MKTHKKKKKQKSPGRVFWRDFMKTAEFKRMQRLLRRRGCALTVKFGRDSVAKDAYVTKR